MMRRAAQATEVSLDALLQLFSPDIANKMLRKTPDRRFEGEPLIILAALRLISQTESGLKQYGIAWRPGHGRDRPFAGSAEEGMAL